MNKQHDTLIKLAETALLAALCYVTFTFLQIKIPVPGGGMPHPIDIRIAWLPCS